MTEHNPMTVNSNMFYPMKIYDLLDALHSNSIKPNPFHKPYKYDEEASKNVLEQITRGVTPVITLGERDDGLYITDGYCRIKAIERESQVNTAILDESVFVQKIPKSKTKDVPFLMDALNYCGGGATSVKGCGELSEATLKNIARYANTEFLSTNTSSAYQHGGHNKLIAMELCLSAAHVDYPSMRQIDMAGAMETNRAEISAAIDLADNIYNVIYSGFSPLDQITACRGLNPLYIGALASVIANHNVQREHVTQLTNCMYGGEKQPRNISVCFTDGNETHSIKRRELFIGLCLVTKCWTISESDVLLFRRSGTLGMIDIPGYRAEFLPLEFLSDIEIRMLHGVQSMKSIWPEVSHMLYGELAVRPYPQRVAMAV